MNFIPVQFRLLAAVAAFAVVAILSAAGGAQVATWKAETGCAESKQALNDKITSLKAEIVDLKEAIATANQALEIAKAQTVAIEQVQTEAAKLAEEKAKASQTRLEQLEEEYSKATSCGDVLDSYWKARK